MNKTSQEIERIRSLIADVRRAFGKVYSDDKLWKERLECVEGLLTCGISTLYSINEDIVRWEIKCDEEKRGKSYKFNSRGVGLDVCPGCFVCGSKERSPDSNHYLNNISGYIDSVKDGDEIVNFFNGLARVDYRDFEPNYIQLKVGACGKHLDNLKKLDKQICENNGRIRQIDVDEAKALV